jgi:RNA polymerase sigma-70 factor (ECF subfamily)
MPEPHDDVAASLVQARGGSPEALGQALELCRRYLLEIANAELDTCLQAKAGASDLVQETFLEAQRVLDRFHGKSAGELRAWLRAILLNKLGTFTRQYKGTAKRALGKEIGLTNDDDTPRDVASPMSTPSSLVRRDERETIISAALDRLPQHYRQVIVWRQMENLSFEEMAVRLERSVDAVRKLWFRALQQLQQELGNSI